MYFKSIIIFIVYHLIVESQSIRNNGNIETKSRKSSYKIQDGVGKCLVYNCSSNENPICVHVKQNSGDNKKKHEMYIEMLNKCELDNMKCYKDMKAIVVPMELCSHKNFKRTGKYKKGYSPLNKKRVKRGIGTWWRRDDVENDENDDKANAEKLIKEEIENEKNAILEQQNVMEEEVQQEQEEVNVNDEEKEQEAKTINEEEEEKKPVTMSKKQKDDDDAGNDVADVADCPTSCEASNRMICARCNHGIYKTFPSICHVKAFNCKHSDEGIELVSRYPCSLSAPYLQSIDTTKPSENAPTFNDIILKHVVCRFRGYLDSQNKEEVDKYCSDYVNMVKGVKGNEEAGENIEDNVPVPEDHNVERSLSKGVVMKIKKKRN